MFAFPVPPSEEEPEEDFQESAIEQPSSLDFGYVLTMLAVVVIGVLAILGSEAVWPPK